MYFSNQAKSLWCHRLFFVLTKSFYSKGSVKEQGLTESQLKQFTEDWLKENFKVTVNLSMKAPLENLQKWDIVETSQMNGLNRYSAVSLDIANSLLPDWKRPPLLHHADLLNINIERTVAVDGEQSGAYLNYEGRFDWTWRTLPWENRDNNNNTAFHCALFCVDSDFCIWPLFLTDHFL